MGVTRMSGAGGPRRGVVHGLGVCRQQVGAGLPGGLTQSLDSCWRGGWTRELEPWGEVEAGGVSLSRRVVRPEAAWIARGRGEGVERAES